jgi:hypothetical protein
LNGDVLGFYKDWRNDNNVWDKILPLLDEKLKSELKFKKED